MYLEVCNAERIVHVLLSTISPVVLPYAHDQLVVTLSFLKRLAVTIHRLEQKENNAAKIKEKENNTAKISHVVSLY